MENNVIARLKKGNNYLSPEIEILADDALDELSKSKLETFLKNWVYEHIKEILGDLLNLNKENVSNKYIRALMFQLFENNGVIKRELVSDIVKAVKVDERKKFGVWASKLVGITFIYQKCSSLRLFRSVYHFGDYIIK